MRMSNWKKGHLDIFEKVETFEESKKGKNSVVFILFDSVVHLDEQRLALQMIPPDIFEYVDDALQIEVRVSWPFLERSEHVRRNRQAVTKGSDDMSLEVNSRVVLVRRPV